MPKGFYRKRRNWKEQDLDFLEDNSGILSVPEMAKRLNRSVTAIKIIRYRRGLTKFWESGNCYSCTMLAAELGRCRTTIRKWWKLGYIKGTKANYKAMWGNKPYIFLEQDIVAFLKEHGKIHFPNNGIPNRYFHNVLAEVIDTKADKSKN